MNSSIKTLAAVLATAAMATAPAWAQPGAGAGQGQQDMQNNPAAQQQQQQQQGFGEQQQQQDFSDEELDQFNDARKAVEEVRNEYAGKLQGVEDADKARELQTEASQKMAEEVRDAGLDVETYNAIAMAMRTDPELRQRLLGDDS